MKTSDLNCSESLVEHNKKEEIEVLKELYPEIDCENKLVLFVKSDLWFPFEYKSKEARTCIWR